MEAALRPVFEFFRQLNPRHVHYKVCSTFDSSPQVGSIGRAIDVGCGYFPARFVPLLVGMPDLGRYCVFGNLYARFGTGGDGPVYRIDRHPSMSRHPVTPATESDLRLVLGAQTRKRIALFDLFNCRLPAREARQALDELLAADRPDVVLFDALADEDLAAAGRLLEQLVPDGGTLFSAGSSAVEAALVQAWGCAPQAVPEPARAGAAGGGPVMVVSGSCSPVTTRQLQFATAAGFATVAPDTAALAGGDADAVVAAAVGECVEAVSAGRSVVVHTHAGEDDPRLPTTAAAIGRAFPASGQAQAEVPRLFGRALGAIAREVLCRTGIGRLVVAGGDTSGHVAAALGVSALTVSRPFVRGAPWCRMHAPGSPLHGREINFKGGQVGQQDYFVKASTCS
jgi:uncharacterized protein YgbK (DUF1537 family)